jgi:ubiquinone/menaquinone biosynthesis C-methylase UbiE
MKIADLKINRILDLATGVGQFIPYLLNENKSITQVIGLDICERSIAQAEKNFQDESKVSFMKVDAESLPFANDSFDAISINNSLHHFEKIGQVLAQARRVLSPAGYLIVNEMTSDSEQNQAQQSHILIHHWFAEIDRQMGRFHDETYTSKKLRELVKSNGFEIIEEEIYNQEIANPKDEKFIENYTRIISQTKERLVTKLPDSLVSKAEDIIKHLQDYGYSPAKAIMMIAKKNEE